MPLTATKLPSSDGRAPRRRSGYTPPRHRYAYPFADLLLRIGRTALEDRQMDFLRGASSGREAAVFYAGELDLLDAPTVSIVGTREVSDAGWKRASQLARELAKTGVTIVSGLAKGVDTVACMAVNDVFVMNAWGKHGGVGDKILMLADGNGEYVKSLGLEMDASGYGMGHRGQRFVIVAKNGVATHVNIEAPGEFKVSAADYVLKQL